MTWTGPIRRPQAGVPGLSGTGRGTSLVHSLQELEPTQLHVTRHACSISCRMACGSENTIKLVFLS